MPMGATPFRDPFQGPGKPRGSSFTLDHPRPLLRAAPIVSKAEKLKGLRFYVWLLKPPCFRGVEGPREPQHSRLVGMQRQAILRTPFRQRRADTLRIPFGG